jgi:hypothetical protein
VRDQSITRPLPTQDKTNTEQMQTNIHALSRIRIHNPGVSAGEDSSCLTLRGHCDRPKQLHVINITQNEPDDTKIIVLREDCPIYC